MKTWDILIPTFHARTGLFTQLLEQLEDQMREGVKVIVARDDRTEPIGPKRQRLLDAATADYVAFLDDDAKLHPHYVELIHEAMQYGPDVVGFILQLWNADGPFGELQRHSIAFHGIEVLKSHDCYWGLWWCDLGTWMPIKREIAVMAEFVGHRGEDARWTRDVLKTGRLKREVYIDEVLAMPQILDGGFDAAWQPVDPTPNPQRPFVQYI